MVAKRSGPGIVDLRMKLGSELVDEHIAVVGPRNSGKSFLAAALAARFHDGGRGNTVEVRAWPRGMQIFTGSPEQHRIIIYDGFLPEPPYQAAMRVISVAPLS